MLEGEGEQQLIVGQEESGALLGRLQELPGFDNGAFIAATTSSDTAEFLCWQKPG